jgi:hypothetical protein
MSARIAFARVTERCLLPAVRASWITSRFADSDEIRGRELPQADIGVCVARDYQSFSLFIHWIRHP